MHVYGIPRHSRFQVPTPRANTQTHKHTHKHTQSHTNTHKHTQTHTHKHTQTHKQTHTGPRFPGRGHVPSRMWLLIEPPDQGHCRQHRPRHRHHQRGGRRTAGGGGAQGDQTPPTTRPPPPPHTHPHRSNPPRTLPSRLVGPGRALPGLPDDVDQADRSQGMLSVHFPSSRRGSGALSDTLCRC